jgi:hypothetical protein
MQMHSFSCTYSFTSRHPVILERGRRLHTRGYSPAEIPAPTRIQSPHIIIHYITIYNIVLYHMERPPPEHEGVPPRHDPPHPQPRPGGVAGGAGGGADGHGGAVERHVPLQGRLAHHRERVQDLSIRCKIYIYIFLTSGKLLVVVTISAASGSVYIYIYIYRTPRGNCRW